MLTVKIFLKKETLKMKNNFVPKVKKKRNFRIKSKNQMNKKTVKEEKQNYN